MRAKFNFFFSRLLNRRYTTPTFNPTPASVKMASASTAAILYASTIAASQTQTAKPDDVAELRHHAKAGNGFINPWESYQLKSGWQIGKDMLL
jgi:hypothetical protein